MEPVPVTVLLEAMALRPKRSPERKRDDKVRGSIVEEERIQLRDGTAFSIKAPGSVQQYVVGKKPRGLRTVGFGVRAAVLPWPAKSDALPLL